MDSLDDCSLFCLLCISASAHNQDCKKDAQNLYFGYLVYSSEDYKLVIWPLKNHQGLCRKLNDLWGNDSTQECWKLTCILDISYSSEDLYFRYWTNSPGLWILAYVTGVSQQSPGIVLKIELYMRYYVPDCNFIQGCHTKYAAMSSNTLTNRTSMICWTTIHNGTMEWEHFWG